jgi:hypothetical protein
VWISAEHTTAAREITPEDATVLQNILEETAAIQFSQPPALHFMPFSSIGDNELRTLFKRENLRTQLANQRKQVRVLLQHV